MRLIKHTKEVLEDAIKQSKTWVEVAVILGIKPTQGSQGYLARRSSEYGISNSHFDHKHTYPRGKKKDIEFYLRKDSKIKSHQLKMKLLESGLKQHRCEKCLRDKWNGSKIPIELDHVNGVFNDNRLENLRILCPNCHAQTETYRGRNIKILKKQKPKSFCVCGKVKGPNSIKCKGCDVKSRLDCTTINYPPLDELKKMVATTSYSAVGRLLGVSDNAVRKHIAKRDNTI